MFNKYIFLNKKINCNLDEIARLRELAETISTSDPSREFISGGPQVQCRFAEIVDKIIDLENDLANEIAEYVEYKKELHQLIKKLSPVHELVLRYRYIEGLTIEEIAEKLDCSVRHVYNLKSAALKECERLHFIS